MSLNATVHFGRLPQAGEEWIRRTPRTTDREYDIVVPVESITIRLDPYEQDFYEIKYLPDTNEVVVLLNDEAVSSYIMEPL